MYMHVKERRKYLQVSKVNALEKRSEMTSLPLLQQGELSLLFLSAFVVVV